MSLYNRKLGKKQMLSLDRRVERAVKFPSAWLKESLLEIKSRSKATWKTGRKLIFLLQESLCKHYGEIRTSAMSPLMPLTLPMLLVPLWEQREVAHVNSSWVRKKIILAWSCSASCHRALCRLQWVAELFLSGSSGAPRSQELCLQSRSSSRSLASKPGCI